MAETKRVLAAIVFTDVVGYSAKVQQEEEKTLALVARDLKTFSDVCTANQGRVVKNTGDGLLMYFTSLDSAVQSATQMLEALDNSARNAAPDKRLEHRIGIHLGDVILQSDDVVGDGVNIAARLMGEAKPDTICISQSGFDIIKSRTRLTPTFIGPRQLKNIKDPVPAVLLHYPAHAAAANRLDSADGAETGTPQAKSARSMPKPLLLVVMLLPLMLMAGLTVYLTQFGNVTGRTTTSGVRGEETPETSTAVTAQTGSTSQAAAQPASPTRNPYAKVNLLDKVDVNADAVLGQWVWKPDGLACAVADAGGEGYSEASLARVKFPVKVEQVPREYDLNVSFTRNSGSRCVALLFPVGQGRAALELGSWVVDPYATGGNNGTGSQMREVGGICFIGGRGLVDTHSKFGLTLETSARYNVTIRVRAERVIVVVNGSERSRIETSGENLTNPQWTLPAEYGLGVGASRSAATFHSAELVPYRREP